MADANLDTGIQTEEANEVIRGPHTHRVITRREQHTATTRGTHKKSEGNFAGNAAIAVGDAAQFVESTASFVPFFGAPVVLASGAVSAVSAGAGHMINGDIKEGAHQAISRATMTGVRTVADATGTELVDGAVGLVTGETLSSRVGNFTGRVLTGREAPPTNGRES